MGFSHIVVAVINCGGVGAGIKFLGAFRRMPAGHIPTDYFFGFRRNETRQLMFLRTTPLDMGFSRFVGAVINCGGVGAGIKCPGALRGVPTCHIPSDFFFVSGLKF